MTDPAGDRRLQSARAALTAKWAQLQLEKACSRPEDDAISAALQVMGDTTRPADLASLHARAVEPLSFAEAKQFAQRVWAAARPDAPPVQVSRQEDFAEPARAALFNPNAAGEARWDRPGGDLAGRPRTGELEGTTGPVPYIDVTDEALQQLTLLHELAHLVVDDEDRFQGHDDIWANAFATLIATHVHELTANLWRVLWELAREWATEQVDRNPTWGHSLLE